MAGACLGALPVDSYLESTDSSESRSERGVADSPDSVRPKVEAFFSLKYYSN